MMGVRSRISVVIVVTIILIAAFTLASFTHDTIATKEGEKPDVTPLIQQEMSNPANNITDQAVLLIYSNQKWSGNILDSEAHSVTQDGKGDSKIFFACSKQDSNRNPGFYSLTFQKLKSSGYLELAVIQNGRLLNRDITTAAFGVVGISGDCDKQQSSSPSSSVSSEDNNVIGTIGSSSSSNNRNDFAFTEFLEVSPNLKGVVMSGPTNRFVDDGGTLHIVGELRNDGIRTVNVFHMVATLYGPNNKTLGLDYANPTPALLSPGQNASFELFVGGESAIDGISDLGQITKVKYHVGY